MIKDQVKIKFETIDTLLNLIKNYQPLSVGQREAERLHHYRDVICEDITYIVEDIIKNSSSVRIE